STYTDGGFKLTTGNHALSVTTGSFAFTTATAFDSGTAGTTIAASSGSALTAGDGVTGGLHLSEADLNRVTANGLTLKTTGATDHVTLAGSPPRPGLGALLPGAGRAVLISGNVDAAAATLTLGAAGAASQSAGIITAATLAGATGNGATLTRANVVGKLGNFSNVSGDVRITNAQTLSVIGTVDAGAGNTLVLTTTGAGSQLLLRT